MNETIKEWLAKSDGDFHTASREADAIESPNYDAVCFHAQQCVEKLMKAVLINAASFRREPTTCRNSINSCKPSAPTGRGQLKNCASSPELRWIFVISAKWPMWMKPVNRSPFAVVSAKNCWC